MAIASFLLFALAACQVRASPIQAREVVVTVTKSASESSPTTTDWDNGKVEDFPIHSSCNSTQRRQLEKALGDTIKIAQHAKEHLLRFGNESALVTKYFGNASTAEPIGWYTRVVEANREGMLFRCDDPDRNCATQSGWAGHWRGSNATGETVICPLSFTARQPLEALCGNGYTVAEGKLNTYWAVDLLHRIFHVPVISEDVVSHYAANYTEVIALAKTDSSKSTKDSDALQLFAIDAYAYDIAAPGVGCSGGGSSQAAAAPAQTTPPTAATTTSAAPVSCHTHSDGAVHCGAD